MHNENPCLYDTVIDGKCIFHLEYKNEKESDLFVIEFENKMKKSLKEVKVNYKFYEVFFSLSNGLQSKYS